MCGHDLCALPSLSGTRLLHILPNGRFASWLSWNDCSDAKRAQCSYRCSRGAGDFDVGASYPVCNSPCIHTHRCAYHSLLREWQRTSRPAAPLATSALSSSRGCGRIDIHFHRAHRRCQQVCFSQPSCGPGRPAWLLRHRGQAVLAIAAASAPRMLLPPSCGDAHGVQVAYQRVVALQKGATSASLMHDMDRQRCNRRLESVSSKPS
jgi:hypothetical protein